MVKLRNVILSAGMAAVLIACGGGSSTTDPLPSLYAGSWTGTWSGPLSNDGGTITFTVTSDGSLNGTMSRSGSLSGPLEGIISGTGHLTATAGFPSSGNFLISGSVVTLPPNAMSGTFNYAWLGQNYQGTLSATSASTTTAGGTTGG